MLATVTPHKSPDRALRILISKKKDFTQTVSRNLQKGIFAPPPNKFLHMPQIILEYYHKQPNLFSDL